MTERFDAVTDLVAAAKAVIGVHEDDWPEDAEDIRVVGWEDHDEWCAFVVAAKPKIVLDMHGALAELIQAYANVGPHESNPDLVEVRIFKAWLRAVAVLGLKADPLVNGVSRD